MLRRRALLGCDYWNVFFCFLGQLDVAGEQCSVEVLGQCHVARVVCGESPGELSDVLGEDVRRHHIKRCSVNTSHGHRRPLR